MRERFGRFEDDTGYLHMDCTLPNSRRHADRFALGAAPMMGLLLAGKDFFLAIIAQKLYGGINRFPLLAIPMFILAGEIMNVGGITERPILQRFWLGI